MMHPDNSTSAKILDGPSPAKNKRIKGISLFRKICEMQHRLYTEAMKAKGRELCALVDAFERLENLKRLMKGLPSPDALARAGKLSASTVKSRARKSTPFPEPIEPDEPTVDRPTTDDRPKSEPEVDREGISFGMEG